MLIVPKQFNAARAKRMSQLYGAIKWKQFRPLAPNQLSSWTLKGWWRAPESIQAGGTLTGTGSSVPNVTVTTTDNFIHPYGLYVDILPPGGARGAATFDCGIDNPVRSPGARLLVGATTAATVAVPTTPYTLNFSVGTYSADADYQMICPAWLDKVGAYPASANNFITGSGAATSSRPIICNPGNLGVPCIRFDGVNDYLETTGTIATYFSGLDVPFSIISLVDVLAVPAAPGFVYAVSNLTDADLPFMRMGMTASGAWVTARRSDAGVAKTTQSNFDAFSGVAFLIDSFDGTNRHLSWNTADVIGQAPGGPDPIGGGSLVSAPQGGITMTPTRMTLGNISDQAGRSGFLKMDLYEMAIGTGEPSLQDFIGVCSYMLNS